MTNLRLTSELFNVAENVSVSSESKPGDRAIFMMLPTLCPLGGSHGVAHETFLSASTRKPSYRPAPIRVRDCVLAEHSVRGIFVRTADAGTATLDPKTNLTCLICFRWHTEVRCGRIVQSSRSPLERTFVVEQTVEKTTEADDLWQRVEPEELEEYRSLDPSLLTQSRLTSGTEQKAKHPREFSDPTGHDVVPRLFRVLTSLRRPEFQLELRTRRVAKSHQLRSPVYDRRGGEASGSRTCRGERLFTAYTTTSHASLLPSAPRYSPLLVGLDDDSDPPIS